jgi:predicted dehydrogenase
VAVGLQFESGAIGTFLLSDAAASPRSWEQTSRENHRYPTHPEEDCYHIAGSRGSLSIPTMRLKTYDADKSWWTPFAEDIIPVIRQDPLRLQLQHFLQVIEGKATPWVTLRDGLMNLIVCNAIRQSGEEMRPVRIPPAVLAETRVQANMLSPRSASLKSVAAH